MAERPKSVKLGGKELDHILSATFRVASDATAPGQFAGRSNALQIVLTRDAAEKPSILGFKHGSNEDGRFTATTFEVTLQHTDRRDAWTLKANTAFVASYHLSNPAVGQSRTREVITIYAGDVTVTAGTDSVNYKLADFDETRG